jgi:hypothetical protein
MKCYQCGRRMTRTAEQKYGAYLYRFYHCRCGLNDVAID